MGRKVYEHSVYWETIKALERKTLTAFSPAEVDRCWRLMCARDKRHRVEAWLHQRMITSEGVYTEHGRIFERQYRKTFAEDPEKGRYLKKCDIMEEDAAQMVHYFHTLYNKGKELVARLNPVYRKLRQIQRSKYYEAEMRRRRELAADRRKQSRPSTTNAKPTPKLVRDAWNRRKESKAEMIRLGSILLDLDCYMERSYKVDEHGVILSRTGGIHEWLRRHLPDLEPHYKLLMSYKAMAKKLRQAAALRDPHPTEQLLAEKSPRPIMKEILAAPQTSFLSIQKILDLHLSPEKVMNDLIRASSPELRQAKPSRTAPRRTPKRRRKTKSS